MNRRRPFSGLTALVAACAVACSACSRVDPPAPPNVLLILVDTLRADRLGAYGNPRGLTPFLDELASRGTVFTHAYAASSWTCPSVASLFTSRYGSQHGVDSFEASLADSEVTLAELLAARGYTSAGFSANLRMLKSLGYAQGFDSWEAYSGAQTGGVKPRGSYLRRDALKWLRERQDGARQRPAFMYLQYMEPHSPYEPLEPYRSQFIRRHGDSDERTGLAKLTQFGIGRKDLSDAELDVLSSLYDGEVAAVDAEIRALFDELEQSGFLQHAVIVITADHGEEFGEHNAMLHGFTLYNPAIHVPLIILGPGAAAGRVVEQNVSLVDVAPTLLDLLGAPPAPTFEGRSLVPLLRSGVSPAGLLAGLVGEAEAPDVISEIEPIGGAAADWRLHARALIRGQQKLLVTPQDKPILYDLGTDPGEMKPLWRARPTAAALQARLAGRRLALQQRAVANAQRQPLDEATKEKLRALGYHQ